MTVRAVAFVRLTSTRSRASNIATTLLERLKTREEVDAIVATRRTTTIELQRRLPVYIAYFTAGAGSSTLPIRIYSMVKRGVTPDVNALSTMILLVTLVLLYLGIRLQRTESRRSG